MSETPPPNPSTWERSNQIVREAQREVQKKEEEKRILISEEIEPALGDINFSGLDSSAIDQIAAAIMEATEQFKLTKDERGILISRIHEDILKSRKYLEQFPPTEIAQALVSLLTTGTMSHFTLYVPDAELQKSLKSIRVHAEKIKLDRLKREIDTKQ